MRALHCLHGAIAAALFIAAPAAAQTSEATARLQPGAEPVPVASAATKNTKQPKAHEKRASVTQPISLDVLVRLTWAYLPADEYNFWHRGIGMRFVVPIRTSDGAGNECQPGEAERSAIALLLQSDFRWFQASAFREDREIDTAVGGGEALWIMSTGLLARRWFDLFAVQIGFDVWGGLGLNSGAEVRYRHIPKKASTIDSDEQFYRLDLPWGVGPAGGFSLGLRWGGVQLRGAVDGMVFDDEVSLSVSPMVGIEI